MADAMTREEAIDRLATQLGIAGSESREARWTDERWQSGVLRAALDALTRAAAPGGVDFSEKRHSTGSTVAGMPVVAWMETIPTPQFEPIGVKDRREFSTHWSTPGKLYPVRLLVDVEDVQKLLARLRAAPTRWKLVPEVPTTNMNAAGYMSMLKNGKRATDKHWAAMLAEAPEPPTHGAG